MVTSVRMLHPGGYRIVSEGEGCVVREIAAAALPVGGAGPVGGVGPVGGAGSIDGAGPVGGPGLDGVSGSVGGAGPAGGAGSVNAGRRAREPWRLDLVSLEPGACWLPGGAGMLALASGSGTPGFASGAEIRRFASGSGAPGFASGSGAPGFASGAEIRRFAAEAPVRNDGPAPIRLVALTLDPARALGELVAVAAGSRELVGLSWLLVATEPVRLRINDEPWFELEPLSTARIDLRERPVSRLTVEGLGMREGGPLALLANASR